MTHKGPTSATVWEPESRSAEHPLSKTIKYYKTIPILSSLAVIFDSLGPIASKRGHRLRPRTRSSSNMVSYRRHCLMSGGSIRADSSYNTMRTLVGARGVSSCTRCATCQIIPHSFFWLSSGLERGLEREPSRQRSVFRTAITPITTVRSTSPTFSPVFSVPRSAGRGATVLRNLATPLPASAADGSRCGFRG